MNIVQEIKLSQNPSLKDILAFNENTKGQILEIRNKFGLLLGLGTSIKAFHDMKDKWGNPLYQAEIKSKLNYDTMVSWVSKDATIRPYKRKENFSTSNEKLLKMMKSSEDYWAMQLERFNQSNSGWKDVPDMIIERF